MVDENGKDNNSQDVTANGGMHENSETFYDKVVQQFPDTVKNVENGRNQLHSVIFTFMEAINHSFVGGLYGLKVELENILQEQKQKGGEESNEGMEFIGELANFISSFLEYVRINKKLKLAQKRDARMKHEKNFKPVMEELLETDPNIIGGAMTNEMKNKMGQDFCADLKTACKLESLEQKSACENHEMYCEERK